LAFIAPLVSSSAVTLTVTNNNTQTLFSWLVVLNRRCIHGLIDIHVGSKIIGNIYYYFRKFPPNPKFPENLQP